MATQSAAPRSRQTSVDADDVVVARALAFSVWARKNIVLVAASAVVLLLIVAGLLWYRAQQVTRMQNAATEFLTVQQMAEAGEYTHSVPELNAYIQRFSGTPYADEARILLGHVHLNQANAAQAVNSLRPFGDRAGRDPLATQGALMLASAQQAAGDGEAAVRTYLAVADRAELDYERQEALSNAAAIREAAGNHAGAAELYRRLVGTAAEGSLERSVFEMRLAEAEARSVQR